MLIYVTILPVAPIFADIPRFRATGIMVTYINMKSSVNNVKLNLRGVVCFDVNFDTPRGFNTKCVKVVRTSITGGFHKWPPTYTFPKIINIGTYGIVVSRNRQSVTSCSSHPCLVALTVRWANSPMNHSHIKHFLDFSVRANGPWTEYYPWTAKLWVLPCRLPLDGMRWLVNTPGKLSTWTS